MSQERNMRVKPSATRLGKLVFSICMIGLLVISSVVILQFSNGRTRRFVSNFQISLVAKRPTASRIPGPSGGPDIEIAYPSSINLCIDGCKPHQNWIEFYLPSDGYLEDTLKLKTSLFLGQVFTVGISSTPCKHQEKTGFTCLEMQIRHTLLWALTGLNLTPLSQLRDTNNWWLEYRQKQ
jgi:hypothetical protein